MAKTDIGVKPKSKKLQGSRVALAICGGIGAVESVKVARELRRHAAEVTAFFTPSVENFITALSVEWACNRPVVKTLGADVSHLDAFDAVVVVPATLNTISKSALGLSDNPVTLLIANQLGRKGVLLFIPAMNLVLQAHPLYQDYCARLKKWGANFFESLPAEDRLKIPEPEAISAELVKRLHASRS